MHYFQLIFKEPGPCEGCNPEDPASLVTDPNVTTTCTQTAKGFTSCFMSCSNGGKINGGNKLKLKCKCPRGADGVKVCGWKGRRSMWSTAAIAGLTCSSTTGPVPVPEPVPVTNAPITNAPVTNAPVTNAPVTNAPVTNAPVTNAPVTNAPVTNAPVTNAPVTNAPVTNAPVTTAAPATPAATTAAPTTAAPATPAATTAAPTTAAPATPAATTAAPTTAAPATTPSGCSPLDASTFTGVVENADATGGCPPTLTDYSLVNGDTVTAIPGDPHAVHGDHIAANSIVVAGVGGERNTGMVFLDSFVARHDTCADKTKYGTSAQAQGVELNNPSGAPDCADSYVWAWQSSNGGNNKDEQFGYVSASPDGSYVIAAGVKEGATSSEYHRWLVKLDAATGAKIWEIIMPSTDAYASAKSGYESVEFTADGGFIAGGFVDYVGQFPGFKSGGQIDGGIPIYEKFDATVASATTDFVTAPTPVWTYKCGDATRGSVSCTADTRASVNTMRVFMDNGIEKVVNTIRAPTNAILIVNTLTGQERVA